MWKDHFTKQSAWYHPHVPQLSASCSLSIFISMGMESAHQYSANMPPAAAAFDLGLSYHVFFSDAEPLGVCFAV